MSGKIAVGRDWQLCIQYSDDPNEIRRDYLLGEIHIYYPREGLLLILESPRQDGQRPSPYYRRIEDSDSIKLDSPGANYPLSHPGINYPHESSITARGTMFSSLTTITFFIVSVHAHVQNGNPNTIFYALAFVCLMLTIACLLLKEIRKMHLAQRQAAIVLAANDPLHNSAIAHLNSRITRLLHLCDLLEPVHAEIAIEAEQPPARISAEARELLAIIRDNINVGRFDQVGCNLASSIMMDLINKNADSADIINAAKLFCSLTGYYTRSINPSPKNEIFDNTAQLVVDLAVKAAEDSSYKPALKCAVTLSKLLISAFDESQTPVSVIIHAKELRDRLIALDGFISSRGIAALKLASSITGEPLENLNKCDREVKVNPKGKAETKAKAVFFEEQRQGDSIEMTEINMRTPLLEFKRDF